MPKPYQIGLGTSSIISPNPQSQNTPISARLASKEVRASLGELGLEATIGTPQDLANALDEQARDWKIVIDTIGFKAE